MNLVTIGKHKQGDHSLQITRQSEYAIRTLVEMAKHAADETLSTQAIALRQEIPADFLKKTVKLLILARLVTTQRGINGGLRLARPAEEISLLDIITAVDGPIALNVCLAEGNNCKNQNSCSISAALAKAQDAMVNELAKISLASLAKANE